MARRRKLTPEAVRELREWDQERRKILSLKAIARKNGISPWSVRALLRRETYRDIP